MLKEPINVMWIMHKHINTIWRVHKYKHDMKNDNKNIEMRKNNSYNFIFLKYIIQVRDFQIFKQHQTWSKVANALTLYWWKSLWQGQNNTWI